MEANSTSYKSPTQPKRLIALTALFVLLLVIFCYLLPTDPMIAGKLLRWTTPTAKVPPQFDPNQQEGHDPPLNSFLPEHEVGQKIRQAAGAGMNGTLLVNLGDCAGCINVDFQRWDKESRKRKIALVAVSYGSEESIRHIETTLSSRNVKIPIVRDPARRIVQDMNGYWSGRAYYFDSAWRLRWIQKGLISPGNIYQEPSLAALLNDGASQ